jgi:hypothetical protein
MMKVLECRRRSFSLALYRCFFTNHRSRGYGQQACQPRPFVKLVDWYMKTGILPIPKPRNHSANLQVEVNDSVRLGSGCEMRENIRIAANQLKSFSCRLSLECPRRAEKYC